MTLREWHIFTIIKMLPSAIRVDTSHHHEKVTIFEPVVPEKVTYKCLEENGISLIPSC